MDGLNNNRDESQDDSSFMSCESNVNSVYYSDEYADDHTITNDDELIDDDPNFSMHVSSSSSDIDGIKLETFLENNNNLSNNEQIMENKNKKDSNDTFINTSVKFNYDITKILNPESHTTEYCSKSSSASLNSVDSNILTEDEFNFESPSDSCAKSNSDFAFGTNSLENKLKEAELMEEKQSEEIELPDTVTLLKNSSGSKVYVIGTAHFSDESQNDVSKIISAVHPNVVTVELCNSRVRVMQLDEETILEEAKNINLNKIKTAIKQNGMIQGIIYLLFLSASAHLTKQLGMAPGGEFRRAFAEAKKIPGCVIHLGDRPIQVTLQRAMASLSLWQKIVLGWHTLLFRDPISKEEVERYKQKDLLEQLLAEITGEFPELAEIFVNERDKYLAYSLQLAATPQPSSEGFKPVVVVGVVGMGHLPGITKAWGHVSEEEIRELMRIPSPSIKHRIFIGGLKLSLMLGFAFVCYKASSSLLNKSKFFPLLMENIQHLMTRKK